MLAEFGTGQVFWSMLWFFFIFIEICLLIMVFSDIFRSHDLNGWGKALWTIFVILLPILGVLVGRVAGSFLGQWAGYAGIAFLFVAGALLLWPSADEDGEERRLKLLARARGLAILDLGISISVDELTVGFSAGLLGLSLLVTVIWIGVQAFIASQVGLRIGAQIGEKIRERAEWVAGVALIAVALVLLVLRVVGA